METTFEVPLQGSFADPDGITGVCALLEDCGYGAVALTEHPAPSRKWLAGGGHASFDPYVGLAFIAARTTRLRLVTHLAVLPYRNPLLTAKAVASLDRLSGGRLTLVVGAGYLRSEFAALGRSFEERNAFTDEALEVLTRAFSPDGVAFAGSDFTAVDQVIEPGPVQLPHPPIWVGGNSRRARERAARWGSGWSPLLVGEMVATTSRTAQIDSVERLAELVAETLDLVRAAGRDPAGFSVQVDGAVRIDEALADPDEHRALLVRLDGFGVTDTVVRPPAGANEAGILSGLEAYADAFF